MHRVELKASCLLLLSFPPLSVPNAPCGVESLKHNNIIIRPEFVPNAPCGVESRIVLFALFTLILFLMHRVELKGNPATFCNQ